MTVGAVRNVAWASCPCPGRCMHMPDAVRLGWAGGAHPARAGRPCYERPYASVNGYQKKYRSTEQLTFASKLRLFIYNQRAFKGVLRGDAKEAGCPEGGLQKKLDTTRQNSETVKLANACHDCLTTG